MARIRTIKPSFFKNDYLAELAPIVRLLFIGLWTLSDSEGKIQNNPSRIKSELFPFDTIDIINAIKQLEGLGFLIIINGIIKIIPKDCLGAKRSFSIMDNNVKAWIKIRHILFNRDGKKCRYCGCEEGPFQIDHIIAISNGGTDELSNLVVACRRCNIRKKNLPLSTFLKKYNLI